MNITGRQQGQVDALNCVLVPTTDRLAFERVGNYSIWFTGFKYWAERQSLVGQYCAWPGYWLSQEERRAVGRYFQAAVPYAGADGEYQKGETFAIAEGFPLQDLARTDVETFAGALVADGRRRLLDVLAAAGLV